MKILKECLAIILMIIFFNGCNDNNTGEGIEGLWITAREASHLFGPGAEELALHISRDSLQVLNVRGFFLKNGELKYDCEFADPRYDSTERKITMLDPDSDTLILKLNTGEKILKGAFHLPDNTQKPLDFIRADNNLKVRLFYPRVPDENGRIIYRYNKPVQTDDGLQTESLYKYADDSLSISKLMKEIIDQKYGSLKSLLILKDNKLVAEEYFYGYDRNDLQQLRSCTKSITSIMFGIASDRHKEVNTGRSIFSFFPEYDSLKTGGRENITLEHVLTMMAGYEWDDIPAEMFLADDCLRFILGRPLEALPGKRFIYNSGCSILLGGVISFLENQETRDFAENYLFNPMGIKKFTWETHKDGTLQCGSGLSLRPRDMAKMGLLVLNDGRWLGKQLVSKEWIRESTKPRVAESKFFDYGYQWWHHSKNNLRWWKEPDTASPEEHDLVTAMGHGGQFIMIIRDLNLVVVTTAFDFENGQLALSKIPMVIEQIIPLFEDVK